MKTQEGSLKVWWSSEVPINNSLENYLFDDLEKAKEKISELTQRDLKNSFVTDNCGGLEVFNGVEWEEWESDDGEDVFELTE